MLSLSCIGANLIRISKAQGSHDIAVTSIIPSETLVESGSLVNITVVLENQGLESETFNVTVYRDTIPIETNRIVADLATGQSRTLFFIWDTTDTIEEIYLLTSKEKTYGIEAVATLSSDTDQGDNTLVAPSKIKVVSQYIAVSPIRTVDEALTSGKNYTVSVLTDYNGTDIWGWNVRLTFRPGVLQCLEVRNGDLITEAKDPTALFNTEIDNVNGEVSAGAYFFYREPDIPPTTEGPGTLVSMVFRVVGKGRSNITLGGQDTYVQVFDQGVAPNPYDIINNYLPGLDHIFSGYFSNTITQLIDIAVTSVNPSPTSVIIGETVNITVVVENQGETDETFGVKVYYDYTPAFPGQNIIGTQTVQSLAAGTDRNLVFAWNTTYVKEGSYTITAIASGMQGDIDTSNDQFDSSEKVAVNLKELRPLPITEIIIGAVAVVAVIAVVYFILRRRRKQTPLE